MFRVLGSISVTVAEVLITRDASPPATPGVYVPIVESSADADDDPCLVFAADCCPPPAAVAFGSLLSLDVHDGSSATARTSVSTPAARTVNCSLIILAS